MSLLKKVIRFSFLFALVAFFATSTQAQDDKSKRKSPPMETTGMVGDVSVAINYSAPSVNGRKIFGGLEPYDEVWRTGANEATTFEVSKNVMIEGQELPAGKYGLFTIPGEDKWTIIFNSDWDQWGDYNYDAGKDVLRVEVMPKKLDEPVEQMKIALSEKDGTSMVAIKWSETKAAFSIAPVASN
ncbi:MAG: DUF2911 domain-containing protein [Saprospiraceae bacterium]|nr:DUF2911 domain-containing protein [Saprospiraceae bacterium]